jgi:hypothetical protein
MEAWLIFNGFKPSHLNFYLRTPKPYLMRKKTLLFCSIFLLFTTLNHANAQADSTTKTKPQFKFSLIYNNNLNYYGRTDSLKSAGFFPLAEFWVTSKFYVSAAPIFVNNAVQSFDYAGTVATIGYQHIDEKWLTGLSLVKPIYEQSSNLLQSALKAQGNVNITRLNKIANFTLGADVKLSDRIDYGATAGLDHAFLIKGKRDGLWIINPTVFAFGGTRQFSRTYAKQQSKFLGLLERPAQEQTETYSSFHLLAYEASMPLMFLKGKALLMVTPSYVVPQNLITDAAKPELSEQGANTFYTTFTIKYSF